MTNLTLTVPYAGADRIITGPAMAIAAAAVIVANGLPTIEDMNLTPEMCDESLDKGRSSMGMGGGGGDQFIQGSHTLIMAIQCAMLAPARKAA